MRTLGLSIVFVALAVFSLVGCSETTQSPVQPTGQAPQVASKASPMQSTEASLDSKGQVVHRV